MIGHVAVVQLDHRAEPPPGAKAHAVGAALALVTGVDGHLGPGILALGVRGKKVGQPLPDLGVGATRKHGNSLTSSVGAHPVRTGSFDELLARCSGLSGDPIRLLATSPCTSH